MRRLRNNLGFNNSTALTVTVVLVVIGVVAVLLGRAAGPFTSVELGVGSSVVSPAAISSDAAASGGSYVQFGSTVTSSSGFCTGRTASGGVPADKFPGPECTGWRNTGVTLSPQGVSPGDNYYRIDTPGVTVEAKDVTASVCIAASNVTFRKSRVRGGVAISNGSSGGCGGPATTGVVIEDVEIDGQNANLATAIDANRNFTARRVHVHSSARGFDLTGGGVLIEDSYVIATVGGPGSHRTAIGSNGGRNNIVRHNYLECSVGEGCTSALSLYYDDDPNTTIDQENILVENNLFNTDVGNVCTHLIDKFAKDVRVINNRYGRKYHPNCGSSGPYAPALQSGNGNVFSGNVWDDTGQPVN